MCNTVDSQRHLIDHVRQHLSLLEQIEQVKDEDMSTLALHMLSIVPERVRYKAVKIPKNERTVEAVVKLLEQAITNKLEVQSFSPSSKAQTYGAARGGMSQKWGNPRGAHNANSGSHFANKMNSSNNQNASNSRNNDTNSGSGLGNARTVQTCIFCRKSEPLHNWHSCGEKPKANMCKSILIQERRCLNCLEQGHMVKDCTLSSQCECERGKHSPSICFRGGKRRNG